MGTDNRDTGSRPQEWQIAVTALPREWWTNPSTVALGPDEAHVWQFSVDVPEASVNACAEMLSADEKQRAARFHFQRDARRFTVTRARTRSILGTYLQSSAHELQFLYSEHGKPRIKNLATDIRFNVSHSGEQAVVAVVSGREVGVDVEQIRENVEIDSLAERFFSIAERELMRGLPPEEKLLAFFRFWTCKEAFLKAQAVGLTRSLASFTVDLSEVAPRLLSAGETQGDESRWSLVELDCQGGYASALAVEGSVAAVKIFRLR